MTIIIKDVEILKNLITKTYHPVLIEIVTDILKENGGVITESYRPPLHSGDLHSTDPIRAIDLRSWCYVHPEYIVDNINKIWQYDYKRPKKKVMIYHAIRDGAMHLHVQVHPNTCKFKDSKLTEKEDWKPIKSAPYNHTVLLKGDSNHIKPHNIFIINGYRDKEWNDITGNRLSIRGWIPTHWKFIE